MLSVRAITAPCVYSFTDLRGVAELKNWLSIGSAIVDSTTAGARYMAK